MKRYFSIFTAIALFAAASGASAFPAKKGDKACTDCHKLDRKDAEALVKKIVPNGSVTEIKVSPVKGVWQIEVDAGEGKKGALYLDFAKKHVIAGQIAPVESLDKQPRTVDVSKIPLDDALVLGKTTAGKKVIVFTDPDCPYCRKLHETMKRVVEKRDDIAFAVVLNPLPMHKEAYKKVQALLCSKSQEMLDDAFAGKAVPEPPTPCTADAVERNKALANKLEFSGTPTLVRGDGAVLSGSLPEDKLLEWIDKRP